ncbi:hypothetical protein CW304_29995 [Bacillus sp. UFRGS-B20]|nr:hypothetical protein CW304_29995 [Bacillus sp. UFRGS-B20]
MSKLQFVKPLTFQTCFFFSTFVSNDHLYVNTFTFSVILVFFHHFCRLNAAFLFPIKVSHSLGFNL